MMTEEHIARICHEANRVYCQGLGDDSQPRWEDAPDWQKQSAISGVGFYLSNNGTVTPEQSHESWLAQKQRDGWVYGPVKDPEKKEHPCMVAYSKLPIEQQRKDALFTEIIRAVRKAIPAGN